MFKKYNDTPAAIAIGLVTIFFIIQVILMAFTGETWLEDAGIDPAALPFVYWLGFIFATFAIGLILTFVKGPDGQSIFFKKCSVVSAQATNPDGESAQDSTF